MVAMSLWATNLRQITGAVASQIRMEVYAKAEDKMVTYYYQQKVTGAGANDIDMTDIDYEGTDPDRRKTASHNVKILGETKSYPRVTGHSDVGFFTGGKNLVTCKLIFLKSTNKSEFLASIQTSAGEQVTFGFIGSLDKALYDRPIAGTLVRVARRWPQLIDL
jgi:hypothetical protein